MPWHSSWPVGTTSVRANRPTGQDNTSYIEATMGNAANNTKDHFWDVAATKDGYHRTINMEQQGGHITPATIDMSLILYCKLASTDAPDPQIFIKNTTQDRYQVTPSFKQGTVVLNNSSTYVNVTDVPPNVYGEIFMFVTLVGTDSESRFRAVTGFFRSDDSKVNSWALTNHVQGTSDAVAGLKFGNGSEGSGLNIRARTDLATSNLTWNYRITYRAITN